MDVSAVTGQVTLLPESSGEVLVDVVNTEDVIDALDVGLGGIPGASIRIDSATPALFPGERRRLTLRIQLPTQVPAGRHRAELEVRGVATGLRRSVDLDVDVPPQPALAAGAHPAVRRALRQVDFAVTVTNRGNTPLHVLVRELDAPDTVTVEIEPAEFDVPVWSSVVCRARVSGPRRLTGGDQDKVVDLSVTARSTTPGRPLLESEISQETRVTFRQRPVLSPGTLLAFALITVATLWLVGGFIGLRMFIRLVDPGTEPAQSFFPGITAPVHPDAAITVSGQMVSAVDGSPVAAVTVLACSRETPGSGPPPAVAPSSAPSAGGQSSAPSTSAGLPLSGSTATAGPTPTGVGASASPAPVPCTDKTASTSTVSDGNGNFWLPGLFPGPYELRLTGKGLKARTAPVQWFDSSCSLKESVSAPRAAITVVVVYPADAGSAGPVTVAVHQATAPPTDAAEASASPTPSASATGSPAPSVNQPSPPCSAAATGSASSVASPGPTFDPSGSPSATPAATGSARPTLVAAADGTAQRTATIVLKRLPAPARYDLTVDAGAGLTLTVREVHLNADQKHPLINVTLQPSANSTPSTP
jgi:hypothetical protein